MDDKKILKILRGHPKQLFSAKEIAEILEAPTTRTFIRLKQLLKYELIKGNKINRMLASKIYGPDYKRGLTLYYFEPEL